MAQLSLKFSFSPPLAEAFFERSRDPRTHGKSHTPRVVQWEEGGDGTPLGFFICYHVLKRFCL